MSDNKAVIAFGSVLGLALLSGLAIRHYERGAADDVRERLRGGTVRVRIEPDGLLGGAFGQVKRIAVTASHFSVNDLPIWLEPDRAKDGRLDELVIDLRDFNLADLPVRRLRVTLPRMRFDKRYAIAHRKIRLSETGIGPAYGEVTQEGLTAYILKKYKQILEAKVTLANEMATVEGRISFVAGPVPFRVTGKLQPIDGQYLYLTDTKVELSGKPITGAATESLLRILNPVIDEDRDLHLRGAIFVRTVHLRDGLMIVEGDGHLPPLDGKEPSKDAPHRSISTPPGQ